MNGAMIFAQAANSMDNSAMGVSITSVLGSLGWMTISVVARCGSRAEPATVPLVISTQLPSVAPLSELRQMRPTSVPA